MKTNTLNQPALLTLLLSSVAIFNVACGDMDGDLQMETPSTQVSGVPSGVSEMSSFTEASQQSGLTAEQICRQISEPLYRAFNQAPIKEYICSYSAAQATAYDGPDSFLCEDIYRECSENYTVESTCDAQKAEVLASCQVPVGLFEQCIQENINLLNQLSYPSLDCNDPQAYIRELLVIAGSQTMSACGQMKAMCPQLEMD